MEDRRVREHPILGIQEENFVEITVDGQTLRAKEGETIAAALLANGIQIHRYTAKNMSQEVFSAVSDNAQTVL